MIFSDKATYKKNQETIFTEGNSKGIDNKNRTITSDKITYNKITNIVEADGKVKVEDIVNNYVIRSEKLIYYRKKKIITQGPTEAKIENKYNLESKDLTYF